MNYMRGLDPTHPIDLIGLPIGEGDYVAYPIGLGSSGTGMTVGVIEKINFTCKDQIPGGFGVKWRKCFDFEAERYTLRVRPLRSTGSYWSAREYDRVKKEYKDVPGGPKPVTIQKVKNVVKISAEHIESQWGRDAAI